MKCPAPVGSTANHAPFSIHEFRTALYGIGLCGQSGYIKLHYLFCRLSWLAGLACWRLCSMCQHGPTRIHERLFPCAVVWAWWSVLLPDINPTPCFVVCKHIRCSVYGTPVEQEGDILATMFQHTAHIWHFRATAIATVASLRIMQWSQWSSLWTAFLEAALPDGHHRNASVWPLHN